MSRRVGLRGHDHPKCVTTDHPSAEQAAPHDKHTPHIQRADHPHGGRP
jgi:hypothetical protein